MDNNLRTLNINLTSEKLRQIAFASTDALGSADEALDSLAAYARLKSLESIIDAQLKALEKRLESAAKAHKELNLCAQAEFTGINAAGQPEKKSIVVTIGETASSKDEILADALRADLGVSDAIVDDTADTITFRVPKAARALVKDLQVVPINDRAVKREIALGNIDPKYVITKTKTNYGATATINTLNTIKEAN